MRCDSGRRTSSVLKRPSDSRSSLSTPSDPQKSSVRSFLYPSCTPNGMQSSGLSVTIDRGRVARNDNFGLSVCLPRWVQARNKVCKSQGNFAVLPASPNSMPFQLLLQPTRSFQRDQGGRCCIVEAPPGWWFVGCIGIPKAGLSRKGVTSAPTSARVGLSCDAGAPEPLALTRESAISATLASMPAFPGTGTSTHSEDSKS